jgi:hypothetical protein
LRTQLIASPQSFSSVQIDDDATDLASRIFIYLFFCLDFLESQEEEAPLP